MTDDGSAPTIPDTNAPTHSSRPSGSPARSPDDRYVLQTLLGKGGMGEVWLAHDIRIDRDIAIKMMRGTGDPDATARFLREARVQGRLEHPSVVPVHDLGGDGTAPYFAMKRLTGTTLADVLAGSDTTWTRRKLLARFVDICLAVEFAHQRGVIHRDLKPANIMLGDFGETYVLDWGLARIATAEPDRAAPISAIETADLRSDSDSGGQTKAGAMLGTPGYMAPEQMRGDAIDQRADVFALGCILFELLARSPAIPRDTPFEVTLSALEYRPAARAPDAEIPPELDDACARATASDPAKRQATARELADEVQRFLDGDRDLERRRELAAEHAARATKVFEVDNELTRTEAMREAGRAIALDPRNREAQEMLARLLLKLPDTIPPAVHQKVAEERDASARHLLRAGRSGYILFMALVPFIKLLGAATWPLVTLDLMLLLQIAISTIALHLRQIPSWIYALGFCTHCLMLAVVGVLIGPIFIVPVLIFGSLTVFLQMPTIRFTKLVLVTHLLPVALPLVLELAGVVPSTFHTAGDTLIIHPWAVDVSAAALVVILLGSAAIQLVSNAYIVITQRADQERRQELVHLQSWQLGRLVSTDE